jgi:transcriptional regulator with XRE-family HTH domain
MGQVDGSRARRRKLLSGADLEAAMAAKNLRGRPLARLVDVSPMTIARLRTGVRDHVAADTATRIERVLGRPVGTLFGPEYPMTRARKQATA